MPNLKTIATCSKHKFDALKHHITYLIEENGPVDYVQEAKKYENFASFYLTIFKRFKSTLFKLI